MQEKWEIEPERDDRTGKVSASCPLCGLVVSGMTAFGAEAGMLEHMNEEHRGGRGH